MPRARFRRRQRELDLMERSTLIIGPAVAQPVDIEQRDFEASPEYGEAVERTFRQHTRGIRSLGEARDLWHLHRDELLAEDSAEDVWAWRFFDQDSERH